ncbi:hypothetical protein ETD86_12965 [Nonomuraea turkmeniaca]|uniref:Uncharacterized protein n=1 Tax=Nonomuraea turkmeniaca TaxID=103838 RepID=A0A5S4FN07_9ACTN|nr:hypothetical protein [Nonomuraea turkmeniaca]TMR22073.1 hypothetical protein ETD86_12965 [Nonomuraea turkmeniaca]
MTSTTWGDTLPTPLPGMPGLFAPPTNPVLFEDEDHTFLLVPGTSQLEVYERGTAYARQQGLTLLGGVPSCMDTFQHIQCDGLACSTQRCRTHSVMCPPGSPGSWTAAFMAYRKATDAERLAQRAECGARPAGHAWQTDLYAHGGVGLYCTDCTATVRDLAPGAAHEPTHDAAVYGRVTAHGRAVLICAGRYDVALTGGRTRVNVDVVVQTVADAPVVHVSDRAAASR